MVCVSVSLRVKNQESRIKRQESRDKNRDKSQDKKENWNENIKKVKEEVF